MTIVMLKRIIIVRLITARILLAAGGKSKFRDPARKSQMKVINIRGKINVRCRTM